MKKGFTLLEMVIALSIFAVLIGMVFGLMGMILQGASTLQDNQAQTDKIVALQRYLDRQIKGLAANDLVASGTLLPGDPATINRLIFVQTASKRAVLLDAKAQANGYYTLRMGVASTDFLNRISTSSAGDVSEIVWQPLIPDLKSVQWKFQDRTTGKWFDHWGGELTGYLINPGVVELNFVLAGDPQKNTFDFWVPNLKSQFQGQPP